MIFNSCRQLMDILIDFFQHSNLVSSNKAEEIASHFSEKIVLKNEYQVREGQVCNEYLFLETGFMRAFTYDTDGNDITTAFYPKKHIVFEVSSFFNRAPSREIIVALSDCTGWYITYDQLQVLFHSIPEFREFGRSVLVEGYIALKQRMLSLINETAESRYTALVNKNAEIFQNAPLKYVASYLGITDTSLSRIRKEFSKK